MSNVIDEIVMKDKSNVVVSVLTNGMEKACEIKVTALMKALEHNDSSSCNSKLDDNGAIALAAGIKHNQSLHH